MCTLYQESNLSFVKTKEEQKNQLTKHKMLILNSNARKKHSTNEREVGKTQLACPESRRPLKTLPKPPSPIKLDSLKFLVAVESSRNVKLRATLPFWLPFSLPLPLNKRLRLPCSAHKCIIQN